jgi:hypothetical protein
MIAVGSGVTRSDREFWASLEAARKIIQSLFVRANEYLDKLPQITRWVEQRQRVGRRLGPLKPPPGTSPAEFKLSRFARRAWLITDRRNAQIDLFYSEFRMFASEMRAALEPLLGVLPNADVERAKKQIHPSAVGATHQALQRVAERLDEFWRCRPAPDTAAVTREERFQQFRRARGVTVAAIMTAAHVYRPDLRKWRHDKLPDKSKISQRIEAVLSGRTPVHPTALRRRGEKISPSSLP